ncbi:MAG TPA: hypothetical protein DEF06_01935 [Clostridiales bacterium]|nr:hypothetical protein [Clostridiales bacterium]
MDFLEQAKGLMPALHERWVFPEEQTKPGLRYMGKGDSFTLDFGTHLVGYFQIRFETDREPDSPLKIIFRFAEVPCELEIDVDQKNYRGSLSSTWFQQETVNMDNPTELLCLHRRYSFRYVQVIFPGNTHYQVRYVNSACRAVSSADEAAVLPLPREFAEKDPLLAEIDEISVRTLRDCMQAVFEDGPKRDRRLWLGDLFLQAKANYVTFKKNSLVLRCLYLFAGLPHSDGCMSSAVYCEPTLSGQAWILHDYAMLFIGTLADYYEETGDLNVLKELWPTAFHQAEIVANSLNEEGHVPENLYFIDWCESLDKSAAAQGLSIAMMKRGVWLAELLGAENELKQLKCWIARLSAGARDFYNKDLRIFRGRSGQISVASQMWMILAGVLDLQENNRVLDAMADCSDAVSTVTPYAMHFYVEALIACGRMQEAIHLVKRYWGGMARQQADCFWEVYVPDNPEASPYGDKRINSYCHAWSCTPTYFIRRFFVPFLQD